MRELSYPIKLPGVYVFVEAGIVLYVGSSKNVYKRAAETHHGAVVWLRDQGFTPDRVRIYRCRTLNAARKLETKLIGELNPIANGNIEYRKRKLSKNPKRLRPDAPLIREWAVENGFDLKERGRLPLSVVKAYDNR